MSMPAGLDVGEVDEWSGPAEVLAELGGFTSYGVLVDHCGRRSVETALETGAVLRIGRGRLALPTVREATAAAVRLGGVVSHLSAAAHWGWPVLEPPDRPWVCVPRGRKVRAADRAVAHLRWRPLDAETRRAGVTSKVETVLDCVRDLPAHHALPVVDAALRFGVPASELAAAAAALRGPGSRPARLWVSRGSTGSSNAFESALRALALEAGLDVVPQPSIRVGAGTACPDLLDEGRRLIIEADSWTWHSGRKSFSRDMLRYDNFVLLDYRVLRFSREHVVHDTDLVRTILCAAATGDVTHLAPRERSAPPPE